MIVRLIVAYIYRSWNGLSFAASIQIIIVIIVVAVDGFVVCHNINVGSHISW